MTRRRTAAEIHVLPAEVVPLSPDHEQQAITALAQMIDQWWHRQHRDEGLALPDAHHQPES